METIREQIMDLLSRDTLGAIDVSQELGIPEKEVYHHLNHIARSVAAKGRRLVIRPAECLKCGYKFKKRRRFTPPGKCPRCRETYIRKPVFEIR